jgi:hypothetical protein
METHGGRVERLSHFLHKNLLWLLLGSYAVAAAWPEPGLKARNVSVGEVAFFHEQVDLSLPVLTLAALLLNAGLGVRVSQLRGLARRPVALLSGLAANLLIPISYILGVSLVMDAWHNPDEVQPSPYERSILGPVQPAGRYRSRGPAVATMRRPLRSRPERILATCHDSGFYCR